MSDGHGGAGLVASLHSAVFAESNIESLVNGRLVGIIVIRQQGLLELALGFEVGLKRKEMESDQSGQVLETRLNNVFLITQSGDSGICSKKLMFKINGARVTFE